MSDHDTVARLIARPGDFTTRDGILMAHGYEPMDRSGAMRLMYSPLLARFYDNPWRPLAVRAVSSLSYAAEDAVVDQYLTPRAGLRLLDLCCGTARTGRRWIERGADVLGVDCSLAMLHQARRRCASDRLVLVRGDAGTPYAQSSAFDAALCFAALHLLESPERVMDVAATALRHGAVFFAWMVCSSGVLRAAVPRRVAASLGIAAPAPGWLSMMLARHGFEVVETFMFGAIEFVVARRHRRGLS